MKIKKKCYLYIRGKIYGYRCVSFFFYPFTYHCSPKVKSAVGSLNSFLLSIHTHTHIILIFITCYMQVIFDKKIRQKNILYQITKRQWLPADCWMDMHGKLTKSIKNTKEKKSKQKITNRFGVNVSMVMQGFSNCSPPKSELTDLYWC